MRKSKLFLSFLLTASILTTLFSGNILTVGASALGFTITEDFEGVTGGTSSSNRGSIPVGWTVTPTNQSSSVFTTVYQIASANANLVNPDIHGDNLFRLYRAAGASSIVTAAKEFSIPQNGGLLSVSFDASTAGNIALNKYIKFLNDGEDMISIDYTTSGIMLKNPEGTGTDIQIGTETLNTWVHFEITANLSNLNVHGLNPGEYTVSMNNGTPIKGRLLNGLSSIDALKFSAGDSNNGTAVRALNIDNVFINCKALNNLTFNYPSLNHPVGWNIDPADVANTTLNAEITADPTYSENKTLLLRDGGIGIVSAVKEIGVDTPGVLEISYNQRVSATNMMNKFCLMNGGDIAIEIANRYNPENTTIFSVDGDEQIGVYLTGSGNSYHGINIIDPLANGTTNLTNLASRLAVIADVANQWFEVKITVNTTGDRIYLKDGSISLTDPGNADISLGSGFFMVKTKNLDTNTESQIFKGVLRNSLAVFDNIAFLTPDAASINLFVDDVRAEFTPNGGNKGTLVDEDFEGIPNTIYGKFNIKASIVNETDEEVSGTLILARYNSEGNILIDISIVPDFTVPEENSASWNFDFDAPHSSGNLHKVFFWESINNIKSLINKLEKAYE